ncbi:MAG: hypothetical protein RIM72_00645 [Alphaproteobacteria bacterium]
MILTLWRSLAGRRRSPTDGLAPDLSELRSEILPMLSAGPYPAGDAKRDAIRTFLASGDPGARRTLALILWWCGAFDVQPPAQSDELQRWAGRQEIARRIAALLYTDPPDPARPLFPHPDISDE